MRKPQNSGFLKEEESEMKGGRIYEIIKEDKSVWVKLLGGVKIWIDLSDLDPKIFNKLQIGDGVFVDILPGETGNIKLRVAKKII